MNDSKIKRLTELRTELEKAEEFQISMPKRVSCSELSLSDTPINKILVRKAYCPECKTELISPFPVMYNPYTMEKQCAIECKNCGQKYILDDAYPKIVFLDENDNEVFAHCE